MNNNLKNQWVSALRSGEYQQGSNCLRLNNNFCCLGVLLDIIDNAKWIDVGDGCFQYEYNGDEFLVGFNERFRKQYKLDILQTSKLAELNDGGDNFHFIASWIERNVAVEP